MMLGGRERISPTSASTWEPQRSLPVEGAAGSPGWAGAASPKWLQQRHRGRLRGGGRRLRARAFPLPRRPLRHGVGRRGADRAGRPDASGHGRRRPWYCRRCGDAPTQASAPPTEFSETLTTRPSQMAVGSKSGPGTMSSSRTCRHANGHRASSAQPQADFMRFRTFGRAGCGGAGAEDAADMCAGLVQS